jgi:uncharacterized protein (TIGR03067 family)
MLRSALYIFVACFFTAAIAAADDKTANDTKELQGSWQVVSLEGNGEARPDDEAKELQIVFKGDEIFAVKPKGEDPRSKFKVDSSKTPKTIDLRPVAEKDKIVAGIYSLNNGQLKLCINIFGQDTTKRPTEFKTHEGDGVAFAVLERAKKK